jgi:hypothetical protein
MKGVVRITHRSGATYIRFLYRYGMKVATHCNQENSVLICILKFSAKRFMLGLCHKKGAADLDYGKGEAW